MQGQPVLVLGGGNVGQQACTGIALRDRLGRQGSGLDPSFTGLAGVFLARMHQYPDLGRDNVQLLTGVLANGIQLAAACADFVRFWQIVLDPARGAGRAAAVCGPACGADR